MMEVKLLQKMPYISNNSGLSECPSIAISDNDNRIYVVWEDATPRNHQIFFMTGYS